MTKSFREFVTIPDVKDTIESLPKCFQKLVKGFKVKFLSTDTLPKNKENIGYIQGDKIVVCNPYYYSRQFTFLHEIGHMVYTYYIHKTKFEQEWKDILSKVKNKINQNAEEQFCHFFASFYCRYPLVKHSHPEYEKFFKKLTNLNHDK